MRPLRSVLIIGLTPIFLATFSSPVRGQNPVPSIQEPLVPTSAAPGGSGFTLTVNGTGFVQGAVVNWNGNARATTFVGGSQLTATIPASDIATAGSGWVTVVNPSPGGGASGVAYLQVTEATSSISLGLEGLAAGSSPWDLISADFNGDGKLDMAVVKSAVTDVSGGASYTVSIWLGNGDGTFQPHVDYAVPFLAVSLTSGDFNGDGKLDLAVGSTTAVSILLGNGDGTFQPHADYPVPNGSDAITAGDFNGDGKLDLAVAGSSNNTVSILLGNGDGTFLPHVDYPTGNMPSAVTTGDFNGDGRLDLVVANYHDNTVSILLGNGDGTFLPHVDYATAGPPIAVVAADLNGDGKLDLAAGYNGSEFGVGILLGNGDGTFQPHMDYAVSPFGYTSGLAVGDLNGDGKLDLVTPVSEYIGVYVLLGNGDGTFQPPTGSFLTGGGGANVALGDFNRDGKLDLAVPSVGSNLVSVLLQAPVVTLSSTSLTFADQLVGTASAAQSVRVTNNGSSVMTPSIAVTGNFAQTNTCVTSLTPGMNCTIAVTFTPTATGARGGLLTITDSISGSQFMVPLSGTAVAPAVSLVPAKLTFANQAFGTTSAAQTVTLTNTGSGPLTISNIATSQDFAQTNTCGNSVAAGANCSLSVTFTPTAAGTISGFLSITDNATGSQNAVTLTGTVTGGPGVSLSPSSLPLSAQFVGTTGQPQNVTITNTGNASLTISSITASGDFSQTNTCGTAVSAGANCTISVTFKPTTGGTRTGTLSVSDNALGSPQTVGLTGTGQDFTVAPPSGSSTSASVAPGQPATYTLSVGGEGGLNQTVTFTCTGVPSEATCTVAPNPAAPGTTVTVSVSTIAPSADSPRSRRFPPNPPAFPKPGVLLMLGLLLAGVTRTLQSWRHPGMSRWRSTMVPLASALLLTLALAGCGGVGGSANVTHNPGTPAGTYKLTVSGTVGSGSSALSHSMTLTLNVS